MMDLLTSAMDAGAALAETFSKPVNTGASFTRYGTVVKNNGTTLDVELCGATLAAVPMLTTCAGAKAGDRCLLTVDGPLVTVTGILANADNTHSVRLYSEGIDGFCDYRVVSGAAVCVVCDWLSITANKTKSLGTLPVGLRPKYTAVGLCYVRGVANTIGQINVDSNGLVSLWCNVSADYYFGGGVTFPLP